MKGLVISDSAFSLENSVHNIGFCAEGLFNQQEFDHNHELGKGAGETVKEDEFFMTVDEIEEFIKDLPNILQELTLNN